MTPREKYTTRFLILAKIIKLPVYTDSRGSLAVIEKALPFDIKRVYYIYDCSGQNRGGHRHKKTTQALICLHGSCVIDFDDGGTKGSVALDTPDKALILACKDYHVMRDFSRDAILLVLASEYYDEDDYIDEPYS
jgi:dTDP-4-dehydrorhamnose 3,5-epimerase-like enzyme